MKACIRPNLTFYDWESLFASYTALVRRTDTVLEIGASGIERTRDLAGRCAKLIGVELMPERIPEPFDNVEYRVADWQSLSAAVEPESIDLAVASHVIEHVPDDLRALDELYTVLKPGGVALINTPNRKRLVRAVIEVFQGERKFPWWEHLREYTEEDLINMIEASRFANYEILPVVFGLHGGPVMVYWKNVPARMRRFSNFWEVHLFKE